jgi:glycoside/pentoside/hexuronide:cation symporter, GPH family
MTDSAQKLSVREKVGYGLGDTAANFIFQTMLVFQLSFYTDTFGISALAAGTLFLVVRVLDAVFDPLMGAIADRTRTRWGSFRPWVLWTAVPFGVLGFLTFTTPDLSYTGKLVYAYVTYTLLMIVYSMNNLPYSALSGVMTGDIGERTSLSSYRFVFAMIAAFLIQGVAPYMLRYFGDNGANEVRGYQITMGIFSVLCIVFFVITFATTKERIHPDPSQQSSIWRDFTDLFRNGPWVSLFLLTIFVFITLAMRGGVMKYYFDYFVAKPHLFGYFNMCGLGATIVGILFSKPLAMRFGKRNVFIAGLGLTTVITALFALIPAGAVATIFVVESVRQLCYGFTIPLLWAMMADVADFGEWTTGRRATGMIFSAVVFGLKFGLGVGGAIGGWLLDRYGYVANAVQTQSALDGIRLTVSVYSAIPFAIGVGCLFFYAIDKRLNIRITDELAERRKAFAPASAVPVAGAQPAGTAATGGVLAEAP